MKTEKEKMLSGELYIASDPELVKERNYARILTQELTHSNPNDLDYRQQVVEKLFGQARSGVYIEPPFFCDYGYNIILGENVYFNFNCAVLDVNLVRIGSRTLIGPGVHIYTAMHPTDYRERAKGLEYAIPVTIEHDVWIGGGAIICPGVKIGFGSIIGAGSVVTKNIPSEVFAAGNPCKVIKSLNETV
jgi:maltose O-acetyltransferase